MKDASSSASAAGAAAAAGDAKFMCKTHTDRKIAVYCRDCRVLTCTVCGLTSHSKHACIEVNDADKELKKKINTAAEKCKITIATHYEEKLLQEQAQLATDKFQLAHYEGLLDDSVCHLISREQLL